MNKNFEETKNTIRAFEFDLKGANGVRGSLPTLTMLFTTSRREVSK